MILDLTQNRRDQQNHDLRRLILAGNLLATLLDDAATGATPSAHSVRLCLDSWEHAIEALRNAD